MTARVIVNRLWHHHFGKGIVDTPGNFGANGSRPTHPALLDWLAVQFMNRGWSAKDLHRMIMTSTSYRQRSSRTESRLASAPHLFDPENNLLWRMNLRRLDAEALRDSVIATSGQANYAMGGPPVMLQATPSGLQILDNPEDLSRIRRSVYLLARRSNPHTFLRMFDYPIIDVNCTHRSASATPLQSLALINSEFLTTSARHLARRAEALAGASASPAMKIQTAYGLTLARSPSGSEIESGSQHLRRLEELYLASGMAGADAVRRSFENFAHMLLCSNEFLYVD